MRNFKDETILLTIRYLTSKTIIEDHIVYKSSIESVEEGLDENLQEKKAGVFLNDSTIQFEIEPHSTSFVHASSPAFWNLYEVVITSNGQALKVYSEQKKKLKIGAGSLFHLVRYIDIVY